MNILVTLDRNYILPLQTMLMSLLINHPSEHFDVYLASDDIGQTDIQLIERLFAHFDAAIHLLQMDENCFSQAPAFRYYSKAMYYRLLASEYLPEDIERILYLDPDMLIINSIRTLYEMPMDHSLYAACIHKGLVNIANPVNKIRLSAYESEGYFNSGMLLMNMPQIRKRVYPRDIYDYVNQNRHLLILPDQDILNGLYGEHILPVDEMLWNYDARKYNEYLISSSGERGMDWVMNNTAILHYCGKRKPWHQNYQGRFCALYKHYMILCAKYSF